MKIVCALAIWRVTVEAVFKTRAVKGLSIMRQRKTPIILKNRCATAARRAVKLVPALAIKATTQVPILDPKIRGSAWSKVIIPFILIAIITPAKALLL